MMFSDVGALRVFFQVLSYDSPERLELFSLHLESFFDDVIWQATLEIEFQHECGFSLSRADLFEKPSTELT